MIAWFARNGVAANLLMLVIVVGGIGSLLTIKKELFPQFSLDTVIITVPYRGAAPEEVENGVILPIEQAIQGVDGIKEIRSTAAEGVARIAVEIRADAQMRKVKDDLQMRIDAIPNLPLETERPILEELLIDRDVIWVAVYGDASERTLKEIAEIIRDDLTRLPEMSQVFVQGVRGYEIAIEVAESQLRRYGITRDDVVRAVRAGSLDVPGGILRTEGREILLRTQEQAYRAADFARIPVITRMDGSEILLGDIADIRDGFVETPISTRFNGHPAALVLVREVGEENPLAISRAVNRYVNQAQSTWVPEGIHLATWGDSSFYLAGRLKMLLQNGFLGFLLVMLSLSIFLRPSLAFFVAIGIPVSFLGTFLVGPYIGISINLLSLFAFILVLGIVVDDAIITGESVFSEFQRNGPGVDSAIRGTLAVSTPVTFAVLTTMVAFIPVFFLPGQIGKFFAAIPMVVIPTLVFSLIQSKLVLPYHLSLCHVGDRRARDQLNFLSRAQRHVSDAMESFVRMRYQPFLRLTLEWRYLTIASFAAIFMLSIGLLASGWVRFTPFPSVPSDFIQVSLTLPEGTTLAQTEAAMRHIGNSLDAVIAEDLQAGRAHPILHQAQFSGFGIDTQGAHVGFFLVELTKSELRDSNAEEISERWREKIGQIPGARELVVNAMAAPPSGLPVDMRLTGPDFAQLQAAAAEIKTELAKIQGLFDIRDTFAEGKDEIRVRLKPGASALGINVESVARQVRAAFYGIEAQRVQRGRDDVRIMVRAPYEERLAIADLEQMFIRLQGGVEIPLYEIAYLEQGTGFPTIQRIDRRRVIRILADADKDTADFAYINNRLYGRSLRGGEPSIMEMIEQRYPGVELVMGGEAKDWQETRASLISGVIFVLFIIYALLAIPFKSYIQPIIVLVVIPFGFTGALLGHWITFQSLSILSMLGVIALAGVVVNDSLVFVDYANRLRREGVVTDLFEALVATGQARFRPILLTSITTFAGLVPILLERSLQAQFLIPMATSLGFGVLFTTFVTLLLVPSIYAVLDCRKMDPPLNQ